MGIPKSPWVSVLKRTNDLDDGGTNTLGNIHVNLPSGLVQWRTNAENLGSCYLKIEGFLADQTTITGEKVAYTFTQLGGIVKYPVTKLANSGI